MIVPVKRHRFFCFENITRFNSHILYEEVKPREAEIKTDRARVDIVKLCYTAAAIVCVVVGKTVP